MLENLFVYIPTAFKIARAENVLIEYVLTRTKTELGKLEQKTKPDRNLILKLKIRMIEMSINFDNEGHLNDLMS